MAAGAEVAATGAAAAADDLNVEVKEATHGAKAISV